MQKNYNDTDVLRLPHQSSQLRMSISGKRLWQITGIVLVHFLTGGFLAVLVGGTWLLHAIGLSFDEDVTLKESATSILLSLGTLLAGCATAWTLFEVVLE